MNSIGFAVRFPWTACIPSIPSGSRQRRNTTTLVHLLVRMEFNSQLRSVIFLQVHPVVEAGHLVAIAVEHQRRTAQEFSEAPLLCLAPARVVHIRIHV